MWKQERNILDNLIVKFNKTEELQPIGLLYFMDYVYTGDQEVLLFRRRRKITLSFHL